MPILHVPSVLRRMTNNQAKIHVGASTILEAVRAACETYPDLARHLLDDDGNIRSFVRLFVGTEDAASLQGQDTAIGEDQVIRVVPAIAGG